MACTPNVLKWTAFGAFGVLFTLGALLVLFWDSLFNSIMHKELILSPDSYQYSMWLETPFDINTEIYLFNWTNSHELTNKNFKPSFQQLGPYVFAERHKRSNVVFNDNKTVTFNNIRTFNFKPEKSTGTMEDMVTVINPLVLAMASVAKPEHVLIRKALNFFMKDYNTKVSLTNTARNFMFDGIADPLIDLALKLKLKKFQLPFDKFGFFYTRNASETYEGNYTMWTGEGDVQKTGIMTEWNGMNQSKAYEGECGRIDGSTGEVWAPVENAKSVSMFVPDVCSLFTLERKGSRSSNGIEGNLYVATDKMLDNGQFYPETKCFKTVNTVDYPSPTGARDISTCQYNAPAFISLPHFQMADSSYVENIDGMNPDPKKHKMEVIIEPKYGLPIEAYVAFQANFKLYKVDEVELLKDFKKEYMIPYMWIRVAVELPDNYASLIKLVLSAVAIGNWIGYSLIFISLILFLLGVYIELRIRDISIFGRFQKQNIE